jgi:hypothetical protein
VLNDLGKEIDDEEELEDFVELVVEVPPIPRRRLYHKVNFACG